MSCSEKPQKAYLDGAHDRLATLACDLGSPRTAAWGAKYEVDRLNDAGADARSWFEGARRPLERAAAVDPLIDAIVACTRATIEEIAWTTGRGSLDLAFGFLRFGRDQVARIPCDRRGGSDVDGREMFLALADHAASVAKRLGSRPAAMQLFEMFRNEADGYLSDDRLSRDLRAGWAQTSAFLLLSRGESSDVAWRLSRARVLRVACRRRDATEAALEREIAIARGDTALAREYDVRFFEDLAGSRLDLSRIASSYGDVLRGRAA